MNFQSLKSMVDSLVQTYICPTCNSWVDDRSVEVVWTAGTNINIEVACPNCWKHSIVRAQVFSLDVPLNNLNPEQIDELQERLEDIHKNGLQLEGEADFPKKRINKDAIKDIQITELNKDLKKRNFSVTDMFAEKK